MNDELNIFINKNLTTLELIADSPNIKMTKSECKLWDQILFITQKIIINLQKSEDKFFSDRPFLKSGNSLSEYLYIAKQENRQFAEVRESVDDPEINIVTKQLILELNILMDKLELKKMIDMVEAAGMGIDQVT